MANEPESKGCSCKTPHAVIPVTTPTNVGTVTEANAVAVGFIHGKPNRAVVNAAPIGRLPSDQRRADLRVSAYNTTKPIFYRVAVDGRPNCVVFPTPGAKMYYLKCVLSSVGSFPIDIVAYSVINNRAYFLIASYDQTPVSYRRFFDTVNVLYAKFFNENFQTAGFVFKSRLRVKRVKDNAEIAESIAIIESQPYANFLTHSWAYPYSSYGRVNPDGSTLACRNSLYEAMGVAKAEQLVAHAYNDGLRTIPADFLNLPEIDKFRATIENVLIDYGCYTKRAIPNDIMPRIIAEINERGGFSYDAICSRLAITRSDKYVTLVKVIAELAVNMRQTYDESVSALQVTPVGNALMRDTILLLSDRLGYGIDQIFTMLGFAYCGISAGKVVYFNDAFLVELIRDVADKRNVSIESVIRKFGIINTCEDPNRVATVSAMCSVRE